MRRSWVDETGRKAFAEAIQTIEGVSAAEVVVKVRHHSGSYLHVDLFVGMLAGLAALAFMLFSSRFHFSITAIFIDPIVIGVVFGLISTQLPFLRRILTRPSARAARVLESAQAGFFYRGIRMTRDRTGILVYISLLEKKVELVCDSGVTDALGEDIADFQASIEGVLREEFRAVAVAKALASVHPICGDKLPASADDINELPDEVHH